MLGINRIFKDLNELKTFEKLWLLIALTSTICISILIGDTKLGILSAVTNIMCVILVANGKISNYFWGLIGVIAYSYIAFENKYYGDFMLNSFYYLPMQFIGYNMWKKSKIEADFKSKFLTAKQRFYLSSVVFLVIVIYGTFLKFIGGNLPYIDAISTIFSIVAMFLLSKGYMEQWILWIIVNIVTIYMWLSVFLVEGNEIATLIQWIIFLFNSIYGLINWIKKHK